MSSNAATDLDANVRDERAAADETARQRRMFLLRKLHSLSGVVPVGAFLVEHLWTNATALRGSLAFEAAVAKIQAMPGLWALETFGIFLPLAFHALYGVALAFTSRPNGIHYPYSRNWLYMLQRASGFVALAFILVHLWEFRVQKAFFGMPTEAFHATLTSHLSTVTHGIPVWAMLYLTGLLASVFHFANGLWGFCASWGITVSRPAQRRAGVLCALLGAGLFYLGAATVLYFATGLRLVPMGETEGTPLGESPPCPAP
ncbi:MAG: succinate dehydrogenase cytochrome b558 subunit [Polyangiaceae bacterium]